MSELTVAAFDFDRTVSTRDNVLPFLRAVVGPAAVASALVRSLPDIARGRRDDVKARLARLLAGQDDEALTEVTRAFVDETIARHLRDDVLARVEWHRGQGHRTVLVSASFERYLVPIGERLGFDAALGTRLEVVDGRLTGRLDGPNVRRAEKVRRLEAWLAGRPATVWAYGDSSGDRELLARADRPVRVGRARLHIPDADQRVAR